MSDWSKPHGYYTDKVFTPADIEAAVLAEREACAKVCENMANDPMTGVLYSWKCAAAIRARSN